MGADADALYGYYGYARPYAYGYGYRAGYYGYPYGYYGKRSADAEPEAEADPALLYTTTAVHHPVTSYVAGSPLLSSLVNTQVPVTSVNNVPVVQAAVNTVPVVKTVAQTPVVYNTAAVHTPVVNTVVPRVYSTVAHTPLVYNTLPLTHSLYNALPVVSTAVPAETKTKREAEPEADPPICSPRSPNCLQHCCPHPTCQHCLHRQDPCCQHCKHRPPDLRRPSQHHCQGPSPWSRLHSRWSHPLRQCRSLPQQQRSPGPMLD